MKTRVCPVCGKEYSDYPAISRRDNKTEICPLCGIDEAIDDAHDINLSKEKIHHLVDLAITHDKDEL